MRCWSAPEDSAASRNLSSFVDAQTQERQENRAAVRVEQGL